MLEANPDAKIAVACLSGWEPLLRARQIEFSCLLRQARIDPKAIADDFGYIPLSAYGALLEAAARACGDVNFGLHLAERSCPPSDHTLTYALLSAPDLRTALETLAHYLRTLVTAAASFEDEGCTGRFEWSYPESVAPARMVVDVGAVRILNYVRAAAGPGWQPLRVWLSRSKPDDAAEHERLFGRGIEFNRPVNAITIDGPTLAAPMPNADAVLHKILVWHCQRLMSEVQTGCSPIGRLRRYLELRLPQGVTLEDAARSLNMTPAALRRALKNADLSFKELVDVTRQGLARHYLTDTDLRLSEIALQLGFSEQSAFSRASRRWFGASPRQYRRQASATRVL